jgi:hypothetical protein
MLEDVSPGGQYALFGNNGEILEPELHVLAINWRTEFPVSEPGSALYKSEVVTLENGSITSPYASNFTLPMLVKYWKPEWAEQFLKYHPEFCKLQFCQSTSSYLTWDNRVNEQINAATAISSIPGASNLQYDPGNSSWLLTADPYFKAGAPGAGYFTSMQNDLQQYTSRVLGYVSATSKGLTQFVDYQLYCADRKGTTNTAGNANSWDNCAPDPACRVPDREWQLYRETYFELKEKYYWYVRDNTTCAGSSCIIGSPYVVNITSAGLPVARDFGISKYEGNEPLCGADEQMVSISYLTGPIKSSVNLEIYYPGQSTPQIVQFEWGDTRKVICIPANVPLSTVKISKVTPGES